MSMKNFLSAKICFTLVIIQSIQNFSMRLIKKVIGKMKYEFGGVIVTEFVGLKCILWKKLMVKNTIQQKEWVSQLSLINSKMFCLIKILLETKWKEFKVKKYKLGTYEIDKMSLSYLDDKRYVLDDGICTLAYFHKDSITSCKEIEKDCDKWKRLW